jgi:hypothetical protein
MLFFRVVIVAGNFCSAAAIAQIPNEAMHAGFRA